MAGLVSIGCDLCRANDSSEVKEVNSRLPGPLRETTLERESTLAPPES